MDIIVFAIIVVICLILIMWGIDQVPIQPPFNGIVKLLAILLAVLLIAHRAGLV